MLAVSILLSDQDILARLVSFDTTSHLSNRPLADFICNYLDRTDAGIHITRNDLPEGDKTNLIISRGPEKDSTSSPPPLGEGKGRGNSGVDSGVDSGGGLILCGHLDTVPALEPDWNSDPFTLTERNDRLYARGSCDMKGFLALSMNAFLAVPKDQLQYPLTLLFTCDEELGSLGAQHLVQSIGPDLDLPTACLIGEPTSNRIVRMHKGHLKMRLSVTGRAAHSGSPHLGENAIEPLGQAILLLTLLRKNLEENRTETSQYFPQTPHPVLNLARIHGGEAVNVIPDSCTLDLGIRLLPDQNAADIQGFMQQFLFGPTGGNSLSALEDLSRATLETINDNPPLLSPEDAPLHQVLCNLIHQKNSLGVSFASDGGVLRRDLNLDCILFGPGDIAVAHKPNEFVPIDEFTRYRGYLDQLITHFCLA